jgi:hypothetical protein
VRCRSRGSTLASEKKAVSVKLQELKKQSGAELDARIQTLTDAIRQNPKDRDNTKRMLELERMQEEYDKLTASLHSQLEMLDKQQ